jgi:aspartate-semialdehyde dehydrogenase
MEDVVAVVGATGAVGREILRTLERREFTSEKVLAFASERSTGVVLPFRGAPLEVQRLLPDSFRGVTVALFSAGPLVARELAPVAAAAGALVIDTSNAWRMDPDVPLVVPEVNPHALMHKPRRIIASPDCSTIQMAVALEPLHREARIRHIVVTTLCAIAEDGHAAIRDVQGDLTPARLNVSGETPVDADGWSARERNLVEETRKVLAEKELAVSPSSARVPVVTGHSQIVHVQFHSPMNARRARELLARAPGVELVESPHALDAASTDSVQVGRIRDDLALPNALDLWVVADNLRKGAALNAVQIAELVV